MQPRLTPFVTILTLFLLFFTNSVTGQGVARDSILIDFGSTPSPAPWNNVSSAADERITNLTNANGRATGYQLAITDAFNGINTGGTQTPAPNLGFPATATGDSFFGNVTPFNGQTEPTATFRLDSLNPATAYTFRIFASRDNVTDNREASYVASGVDRDSARLDASNNMATFVSITVFPAADGSIVVTVTPGPNNSNGSGFYYLGAVTVSYDEQELPPVVDVTSDTFLVDFGTVLSPIPWNNLTDARTGVLTNLVTVSGNITEVGLAVIDSFNGVNLAGTQGPDPAIKFPATATGDSFFGNVSPFGGVTAPTGAVRLTGLDPSLRYEFSLFASRTATDNREAAYEVRGLGMDTVYLDAASNSGGTATVTQFPAADGSITITAAPGPNNTNGSGFYYLGAVRVGFDLTPPPAPLDTVLIDFGGNATTPAPWNNVTDPVMGSVTELLNSGGFTTGVGLQFTDRFNGINTNGTQSPDPELDLPATATGDSFFGNVAEFGGRTEPTAAFTLTGLDPNQLHRLALFASRTATDNRETQYAVSGSTIDTAYLDVSSNASNFALAEVFPTAAGTIEVKIEPGPNNNNGSNFYYLGALRLTYPDRAPSGPTTLELIAPNGGERYQADRTATIEWNSRNVANLELEYSTDAGANWTAIDTVSSLTQSYAWSVPAVSSTEALVRITADTLSDRSDAAFEITTDTTRCAIVVLGSSTAAGTGASTADSAWVNRYAASLAGDTRYEVVNLGRGGANTYNILPTGSATPPVAAFNVDRQRNVTRALEFDPFAIIINMPSNDAASDVSAAEQMLNFRRIAAPALANGVKVYVATTQPRNFSSASRIAIQRAVRDSILAEYGDFAIDFWTGVATDAGTIDPDLDSGDGVHLNDGGHKILFERVADLRLDTLVCTDRTVSLIPFNIFPGIKLTAYPNPSSRAFTLALTPELSGTLQLRFIDGIGRELGTSFHQVGKGDPFSTTVERSDLLMSSGGVIICVATLTGGGVAGVRRGTIRLIVR
ncbi:SGNH/GDSL hydrolase family protein [Neolewinella antarctica]|uniref:Lysophospholipase L1-like esterase n=1 Tax=Neolewinella antarctica TaxID=442734 RepID=A0ABX0XHZ3_9BACT|nr:SGNH/GDSL hydrolase family protein [Neolewinella antarctica]NJC28504.1 lysophospholipase L1-like esterase [Neolewinella antarctica]